MIAFDVMNNMADLAPVATSIWDSANTQIDQGTKTIRGLAYFVAAIVFLGTWWKASFKAAIGSAVLCGIAIWLIAYNGFDFIAKLINGTL
ncbi:hypothetical protein [Glutamicibacter soli]